MSTNFSYISLTTDYGLEDEFAGVCHGVIAQIAPEVRVIDVTHSIPPFDVRSGALALVRAIQYLPPGVHIAIVDPGVGTARRAIALSAGPAVLVGPDNGILSPATAMLGGAGLAVEITNDAYRIDGAGGQTFAGRDVFSPAAAHIAIGTPLADLGPELDPHELTPMIIPLSTLEADAVGGEVLWIDRFGNAQLNIAPGELEALGVSLGDDVSVSIAGQSRSAGYGTAFEDGEVGGLVVVVDSYGMLALAVNRGRAADLLGVSTGTSVRLARVAD